MKTTDLIPIILYQLVDGDKYGYEIIKQIEDCSNGGIVIKQPTLYSVLKKLEQGKFISSYWQDSEIGGKRHYYKLTDNGKAQLDTYPALEQLINDSVGNNNTSMQSNVQVSSNSADEISDNEDLLSYNLEQDNMIESPSQPIEIKPITIDLTQNISPSLNLSAEESSNTIEPISFDDLPTINDIDEVKDIKIDNIEIDLPNSNTEFNHESNPTTPILNIFDAIDYTDDTTSSNTDIKQNNDIENQDIDSSLPDNIKTSDDISSEQTNEYTQFTEKAEPVVDNNVKNKLYDKLTPNLDLINDVTNQPINPDISPVDAIEEVKFLNYVDFSTDKNTIKRRKTITKHIQKMALTCLTLLVAFIVSLVVCSKYSFSKLYYISAIIVCLILVLYPILLLTNIPKIRFKYCSSSFKYSVSRDFFIKLSLFLSLIILIFAYNLSIATSIKSIFELNNFANFIAPLLFSLVVMFDFMYSTILYKQYTKKAFN